MILSDRDISQAIKDRRIIIKPAPNLIEQLGSSSLDLRLGYDFRIFKHRRRPFVDPFDPETVEGMTEVVKISKTEPYVIQPHEFVLASSMEWIELADDLAARVDGRSSLGRLGLIVHSTAGHIDAGFKGIMTLEMTNIGMMPILLYPRMRICQLVFEPLSSPADQPYTKKPGAKYHNKKTTTETAIAQEKLS
jgi:dCTP deaminase